MEFLILGPLEVRDGEQTVRLGAAKQRALLGVLLLHANEAVSTSRLVDELWGERPPATAEKLVQGYVHALRKQLGSGVLATQAPGYRLSVEPGSLDLLEFERLSEEARLAPAARSAALRREALALWRGPPLADVVLEGPDRHTVARLNELRLSAQLDQIDADLGLGRHAQLVGELEALSAAHPYQERVAAQLMLALYRSGRQAEALDVYRAVRSRLDDELGLQPGQELRDLEAAILRQDEKLAPPAPLAHIKPDEAMTDTDEPEPDPARMSRATLLRAAVAVGVVAGPATAAVVWLRRDPAPLIVGPNSVAVIDVDRGRVVDGVQVGIRPGPIAYGGGALWIANLDDKSLSRVDPTTRERVKNVSLPATPDAIAFGAGAVWVANGRLGTLYRVDPGIELGRLTGRAIPIGGRSIFPGAGVDVEAGVVWAAFGEAALGRVDPELEPPRATGLGATGSAASGVVAAFDSIWVSIAGSTVQRFDPDTFEEGALVDIPVGKGPTGLAAGHGAVWVACTQDDAVARIAVDATGSDAGHLIPVGSRPTGVAVGAGAVWVANAGEGTVSRLDPDRGTIAGTVEVGDAPSGLVVAEGSVWVTVQAP
jgi:DNA-binding SARP family transcriptional activator/DNA-binding beta-propeller fold protein YncE